MREILFRGRRCHDGQWLFGNLVYDEEHHPHIVPERFFYEDGHHLNYYDGTDSPVFLDEETVSEYTGRKDKNGNRIFEGDIVTTRTGRRCLVRWFSSDAEQAFDLVPCECEHPCPQAWDLWRAENLEVVGNKWDNPDLTGGVK